MENAEKLMSDYQIIVYPRTFEEKKTIVNIQNQHQENITMVNAPIIELSATEIRKYD